MKKQTLVLAITILAMLLGGCSLFCSHEWKDATCTAPKICTKCSKTEGKVLEHTWEEATCKAPSTCSGCGATQGEPLAHTWVEANCTAAKTCSVCATTEGEALGHTWQDATFEKPKTCSVCATTEGEPLKRTGDVINKEFYEKANGYWGNKSGGYLYSFNNNKFFVGYSSGEKEPTGKIKSITKQSENTYKIKITFPKAEFEGEVIPAYSKNFEITFSDKKMKCGKNTLIYCGSDSKKAQDMIK